MEPTLSTAPDLVPILNELMLREPIFHHPEFGTSKADFEAMTDPEFWEVGASGRRYSRTYCIDSLVDRHSRPHTEAWDAKDFHCTRISPDSYLVTYTLIQESTRITRRSTIWRRAGDDWKILYHQGTVVSDGAA